MRPDAEHILIIFALAQIGGPLFLGLWGVFAPSADTPGAQPAMEPWNWRLTIASAFTYTLAFNLVFIVQEIFLVWPKALTPGLTATLYHNNHNWTGDDPIARLYQGTGAVAIAVIGAAALAWVKTHPSTSPTFRLFVIWLAYHGLFESLPQVVVGAFLPGNDVGMAMDYLGATQAVMLIAAVAALAAMAAAGITLARSLLELAIDARDIDTRWKRTRFAFRIATLPALVAVPLILLFRVPGSLDQVVIVPVAVTYFGIAWIQAAAWSFTRLKPTAARPQHNRTIVALCLAVVTLLVIFQFILRPGIVF